MEDNNKGNVSIIKMFFEAWIMKSKNPVKILAIMILFGIGAYKEIIPLSIVPILFCLFLIFCILCHGTIERCYQKWIEWKKYQEEQKTKRYIEKQKRKQIEKEYEYLMKQSEDAIRKADNASNQSSDDSTCKIYEIKRKGS